MSGRDPLPRVPRDARTQGLCLGPLPSEKLRNEVWLMMITLQGHATPWTGPLSCPFCAQTEEFVGQWLGDLTESFAVDSTTVLYCLRDDGTTIHSHVMVAKGHLIFI